MWMFCAFKLSFDVDILVFWVTFSKIRQNFIQFSGHTASDQGSYTQQLMFLATDEQAHFARVFVPSKSSQSCIM